MTATTPTNPIYRADLLYARQHRRGLNFLLILLFGLALFAALIPFVNPITYGRLFVVALIAVPVAVFALAVNLRTILIAGESLSRDLEPNRWSEIVASGIDARRYVFGKWRAVVRQVWGWHVLAGVLRIGVALALSQHAVSVSMPYPYRYNHIDNCRDLPFSYCAFVVQPLTERGVFMLYLSADSIGFPHPIKFVYAASLLLLLGMGEALLCPAIGCAAALIWQRRSMLPALLARTGFGVVFFAASIASWLGRQYMVSHYISGYQVLSFWDTWDNFAFVEQFNLSWTSLAEGGIYVSFLVLRPYTPGLFHVVQHGLGALTASGIIAATALLLVRGSERLLKRRGLASPAQTYMQAVRRRLRLSSAEWLLPTLVNTELWRLRTSYRAKSRWSLVGWGMLYALALFICLTPRWISMVGGNELWLVLITVITLGANVMVGLRTLITAGDSLTREWRIGGIDLIRLTGVRPRYLIVSKWWAVVRWSLPAHLLVLPLKFGLAYGAAQYIVAMYLLPREIFRPFNIMIYDLTPLLPFFPNCLHIGAAVSVLLVITLFEVGFIAALGLVCAVVWKKGAARQLGSALLVRVSIVLVSFGVYVLAYAIFDWVGRYQHTLTPNFLDGLQRELRMNWRIILRILESTQVALSTQFDSGALAAANLMRPVEYGMMRALYVLRAVANVLMGAGLYVLLTVVCLWIAVKRVYRE